MKWWAYKHTNGSVCLFRSYDNDSYNDAADSPFCEKITLEFEAPNRESAMEKSKELLEEKIETNGD